MKTYCGSCHCQKVQFEIQTDLKAVNQCNCSICQKKGALHHKVSQEQFKLLSREDDLRLYQFNTKTAKHYFCKHCGMHPFSMPRTAPEMYSININCLDEIDVLLLEVKINKFDGQNWEESFEKLRSGEK